MQNFQHIFCTLFFKMSFWYNIGKILQKMFFLTLFSSWHSGNWPIRKLASTIFIIVSENDRKDKYFKPRKTQVQILHFSRKNGPFWFWRPLLQVLKGLYIVLLKMLFFTFTSHLMAFRNFVPSQRGPKCFLKVLSMFLTSKKKFKIFGQRPKRCHFFNVLH